MSFISYAQNFEDVMLWRALRHVENGFYIDVGASDPEEDSVTKAFYDRGWHGINIEPLPQYHLLLNSKRPRDVNLLTAAGASDGELTLFDVPDVRGWASLDEKVAENNRKKGYHVHSRTVPVRKLTSICEEYVTGEIHFLKIDVEGFETEVINGIDFEKWRPWILVIEATLPNSQILNYEEWEETVTGHKYTFAYFDGVNRYYVAEEHGDLIESLAAPPNVFDEFITIGQQDALCSAQRAEARLQEAENRAQEAEAALQAILCSTSWRFTAPLRTIMRVIKF
jgi:FkbM family methyltransferase